MDIIINGKHYSLPESTGLSDAVATLTSMPEHVLTEVNGLIINRTAWATTPLKSGDIIEIVTFVGGG